MRYENLGFEPDGSITVVTLNRRERTSTTTRQIFDLSGEASSVAMAIGKQAFYSQIDLDQPKAYTYAKEIMSMNSMAVDAQEGISTFLEKRAACWTGR
jgi:enoyl-CoA hydratase/carnithine racemase